VVATCAFLEKTLVMAFGHVREVHRLAALLMTKVRVARMPLCDGGAFPGPTRRADWRRCSWKREQRSGSLVAVGGVHILELLRKAIDDLSFGEHFGSSSVP